MEQIRQSILILLTAPPDEIDETIRARLRAAAEESSMVSLRAILEDCRKHSLASGYVLIALDLLTIKLDEAMRQRLDADVSKTIH